MARIFLLSLILFSSSIYANNYQARFCSQTQDMQQYAMNSDNELAFSNPSGMDLWLIGDILGMKDGIGACWWHSFMQRSALYLASFRPDLPAPTESQQVLELLNQLRLGTTVVEIPGYANLREFSSAWINEFEEVITEWQKSNTWEEATWTRGLSASLNEKLNPEELMEKMNQLYWRMERGEVVFQRLAYLDSIVVHAWIVIGMEKIDNGYHLTILDSNQRSSFPEGTTGRFEVDYFYGDRYIVYRGDNVVPFFEPSALRYNTLVSAKEKYCQGIELEPEQEISTDNVVVEEGKELTDEQAYQLLYQYLTLEQLTYQDFLYVAFQIEKNKGRLTSYFNYIIGKNEDLPAYLISRMLILMGEFSTLRFDFENSLFKILSMESCTKQNGLMVLNLLLGGGDLTSNAGQATLIFFERFGISEEDDTSVIRVIAATNEKFKEASQILNYLMEVDYSYNDLDLSFIARFVFNQGFITGNLNDLMGRENIGPLTLSTIAYCLIDSNYGASSVYLNKVLASTACDEDVLRTIVFNLGKQWPRVNGDLEILEKVRTHSNATGEIRKEAQTVMETINQYQKVQEALDSLDLTGLKVTSKKVYQKDVIVNIDTSELTITNHSFILEIGVRDPIRIKVTFDRLERYSKGQASSVIFQAPAHFNYDSEKEIFSEIFSCGSRGCSEEFKGRIVEKNGSIVIMDTSGFIHGNQIAIKADR